MMIFLAKMTSQGWKPGIGDPTIVGWATVAIYFFACLLCFREWRQEKKRKMGNSGYFGILWVLLLFLGVNKQLDLQSCVTQLGRMILPAMGWGHHKRTIQFGFILFVAFIAFLLIASLGYRVYKCGPRHLISLIGLILLMAFVVIRAASFHHIDHLLGRKIIFIFNLNHTLEIGSLLVIILGALWSRKHPPHPPQVSNL
jgi:hypothetical protein